MTTSVVLIERPGAAPLEVGFDELPALCGRSFMGPWFSVDPARLALFDHVIYTDENPHPLAAGGYPDEMVEGFHLVGLLDHLINHIFYLQGPRAFGWNYGLDRVRFVTPIRAGERMRLTGSIASVKPKQDGFLVRADCEVQVEGRERPGFVAEWWVFWLPGGADSESDVVQQVS
jgi:hypothetical protein